jgi:anti-sigma regulatory factor (Ser/Thr protein kinase)
LTATSSTIRLELDSKPQSVALARGMLTAVLELLGFGAELLDDVKMATSEACNNVVLHAYGDGIGPMLVDLDVTDGKLAVIVRDSGVGITNRAPAEDRLGVGLPMMETLADRAEFRRGEEGGTEVRLTFGWNSGRRHAGPAAASVLAGRPERPKPGGDVIVCGCPLGMLATVMGRLATIVAASARFSVDRLSDLRLLTDAISADAQSLSCAAASFAMSGGFRRFELLVGPLELGESQLLLPNSSSPSSLPWHIADQYGSERLDGFEAVRIVITDGPPGRPQGVIA